MNKKNKQFSTILRDCRTHKKLSQAGLAKKTGLQAAAICNFESDCRRPTPDNLRVLANALEVSTNYLLGR